MKFYASRQFPFWGALFSSFLFILALPPYRLKYLVFAVPFVWTFLVIRANRAESRDETRVRRGCFSRLVGCFGNEYVQYWFASFLFWLYTVVWVSYPHPIVTLGWLALSAYLACYLPLYVAFCRVVIRFLRLPIWASAPICWVAIEWTRNRVLGGFSFAGLSHAVYDSILLIQIAEPLGEYGVGALIVLIGSLLGAAARARFSGDSRSGARVSTRLVSFALIFLACAVLFGKYRVAQFDEMERNAVDRGRPYLKVAILQDCTPYRFPVPTELNAQVSDKYKALALEASKREGGYDLIVWPEGCYYGYFYDCEEDYNPLINSFDSLQIGEIALNDEEIKERFPQFASLNGEKLERAQHDLLYVRKHEIAQRRNMTRFTSNLGCPALLGIASAVFDDSSTILTHNAAVLVPYIGDRARTDELTLEELTESPVSEIVCDDLDKFRRYDKVHLVMFGEYIPFLKYLPDWFGLKAVCAETQLSPGKGPIAFRVTPRDSTASFFLEPNVCFESSIPHMLKSYSRRLKEAGVDPDILVNVSHDGWFRCGKQTDMHLATHVYRAIENRRSVVTATHGGFSAWIDPVGRARSKGERGATEIVEAKIYNVKSKRYGTAFGCDFAELYSRICAIVAWTLLLASFTLKLLGIDLSRRSRASNASASQEVESNENSR